MAHLPFKATSPHRRVFEETPLHPSNPSPRGSTPPRWTSALKSAHPMATDGTTIRTLGGCSWSSFKNTSWPFPILAEWLYGVEGIPDGCHVGDLYLGLASSSHLQ
jgi:hypothetical protein